MKVLWVTNGYPTKKHPEYCVFTKDQIEAVKKEGVSGKILFINARENGYRAYLQAYRDLKRFTRENNFDLIHCFHGLSLLLVLICFTRKKVIVSFLNSIENEYEEAPKIISLLLTSITRIILKTNSKVGVIVKDKLPYYLALKTNSYYLPNGVDTDNFYPIEEKKAKNKLGLSLNKQYLLFVSSKNLYRKQKRYDRFKEVLHVLEKKYSLNNIDELTISNVPREELIYYYNASSLHLLTSDFEGSPNSVKESISCNTPVVSTNVGNVKEMLDDIPNCKVAESNQPEVLASLVNEVLHSNYTDLRNFIFEKQLDSKSKSLQLKQIYSDFIE